jgi:hypothetical protein
MGFLSGFAFRFEGKWSPHDSTLGRASPPIADIGRIYIKLYLYPISYPKIAKKDIPLSLF